MAASEFVNPTSLGIEQGYPERTLLPDDLTSWYVSLPDDVEYGQPVTNLSSGHGSVVDKLLRAGLELADQSDVVELSRMGLDDVITAKGAEFGAALMTLRFPLGRTGLNGVGIFYEAGASSTSDMIVVHQHEGGIEVPLAYTRNRWNTPGGFAVPGETEVETAFREFAEETGHDLVDDSPTIYDVVREIKQSDRSTDHAWLEANVFAARAESRFDVHIGENADDAKDVRWWDLESLDTLVSLGELSTQKLLYIRGAVRAVTETE